MPHYDSVGYTHEEETTAKRVKEIKSAKDADTKPENGGSDVSNVCTQQLDRLLIKFTVREGIIENDQCEVDTQGSGADDSIVVLGITFIPNK